MVVRKHDYYLFNIVNKKSHFLSKEEETSYEMEVCPVGLNYKQLRTYVPITTIGDKIVMVGGFYNGYVNLIFLGEDKFNRTFKFPCATITAIQFEPNLQTLYIGDQDGYLRAYKVKLTVSEIEFAERGVVKAHDGRINDISPTYKANLLCCCSEDSTVSLYNLYSCKLTLIQ